MMQVCQQTIATSHENAEFVADFREMVYKHLNLPVPQRVSVARIGVIGRSGRRRVLNEAELVAALQSVAPTDLLLFDKMSYKEQVGPILALHRCYFVNISCCI